MDWLALSLLCAFALASSDAAAKHWLSDAGGREILLVRLSATGLVLLPWALTFDLPVLPVGFWLWMVVLIPLEIIAMLLYVQAIRDYPLALTVPYLAFTPVLVVATGWLVLGETIDPRGLLGILVVFAGSWLLNFEFTGRLGADTLLRPLRAILDNRGSRLMLGAAAIYAFTSVGGKAAMTWLPPTQFGAVYFVLLGAATLAFVALSKPSAFAVVRVGLLPILLVAGCMAVMVVTHFMALAGIEAAYMIAAKRTSLLFGILYGALLFRERHLGRHLVAGVMLVAGVAMISL